MRPGNEAWERGSRVHYYSANNYSQVTSSALIVGGALSLTDLVSLLQANQDRSSTFEHLASHLLKVITCMHVQLSCLVASCLQTIVFTSVLLCSLQIANVPVRNVSSTHSVCN